MFSPQELEHSPALSDKIFVAQRTLEPEFGSEKKFRVVSREGGANGNTSVSCRSGGEIQHNLAQALLVDG